MKVKNKKIIVTGGASGIGREIVITLLNKGSIVIAIDINKTGLEVLKQELNNNNLYIYDVDISNDNSLDKFKFECIKEHSYIDGIINNAGIIQPFKNVLDLDYKTIERVMNINFYGTLKLIKMFLPILLNREESHILNVSSMGGFFPFPGQTIYGASKAAVKILSEGLYSELKNTNIRITLVLPGAVRTNIADDLNLEANKKTTIVGMSSKKAAKIIINAMEKNKFRVFVGSDSKIMNFIYKINSRGSINMITRLMNKYIK